MTAPPETRALIQVRGLVKTYGLLPVLRGHDTPSLWAHPADWHPNALAHRLVAEALAPRVRALRPAP